MPSEKTLLRHDEGVELWRTDLISNGEVLESAFFLKSLRTPEAPAFGTEREAEAAFAMEVASSRASELVQLRLGR
ncbi:hypothetical protein NRB_39290 [Novosphingobium sp. 11B]